MVYRLLTTNSVEIMMMERQISKKKLERLTIQGGDFRKAGERSQDTQLSLNKLRNLLEDDVKDLNIKRGSGKLTGINFAGTGACDNEDITKEELDMIMDRERLFRTIAVENAFQDESNSSMTSSPAIISKGNGSSKKRKRDDERIEKISDLIPTEGRMYDIISMDQFTMQSVS